MIQAVMNHPFADFLLLLLVVVWVGIVQNGKESRK